MEMNKESISSRRESFESEPDSTPDLLCYEEGCRNRGSFGFRRVCRSDFTHLSGEQILILVFKELLKRTCFKARETVCTVNCVFKKRVFDENLQRMNDLLPVVSLDLDRLFFASVFFYCTLSYLDYVDIDYSLWLSWLLMPLLITFLLPAVIILLFYISAIIFHMYKFHRRRLVNSTRDWRERSRKVVSAVWDAHGWIWHGYEISGEERIPTDSPVLFIYYHGALPIDMYYFVAKVYMYRNRLIHTVADRLLFKIPGWAIFLDCLHVIPGTVQQCANVLKEGNLLSISPGGVYEAQFGSEYYQLLWKKRLGFAKVALEAKVPIIPLFTMNVREAFRTVSVLRRLFLRIYTWTRIPLAPVYGGFPVKLVTYVGEPIPYDPSLTPEQLHLKVAAAVEELIETHQRVPGSITRGLIERIYRVPKANKKPQEEKSSLSVENNLLHQNEASNRSNLEESNKISHVTNKDNLQSIENTDKIKQC